MFEFIVFLHFQIWRNMAKKKTKKSAGSGGPLKRLLIMLGKVLLALLILSILLPMAYRWINPPVTPLMIIRKVNVPPLNVIILYLIDPQSLEYSLIVKKMA